MINIQSIARSVAVLLGCALAASSSAKPSQDEHSQLLTAKPVLFQTAGMSLDQAVAMVQTKYGARAMRYNTVEEDGRVVHYIRLMSADRSRVWTVRIDAASGREF